MIEQLQIWYNALSERLIFVTQIHHTAPDGRPLPLDEQRLDIIEVLLLEPTHPILTRNHATWKTLEGFTRMQLLPMPGDATTMIVPIKPPKE